MYSNRSFSNSSLQARLALENSLFDSFVSNDDSSLKSSFPVGIHCYSKYNSQPDLAALNINGTVTSSYTKKCPSVCNDDFYSINSNDIEPMLKCSKNESLFDDDFVKQGMDSVTNLMFDDYFQVDYENSGGKSNVFEELSFNDNNEETGGVYVIDVFNNKEDHRGTRSAPPSPSIYRKKRSSHQSSKQWSKMTHEEKISAVESITRIVNAEMGLFEQLEIIRILNPDARILPTDNEFIVELYMLDDEKYRKIMESLRAQGFSVTTDHDVNDACSEYSTLSYPSQVSKEELRLSRQRRLLKLRQKKERLQQLREAKSGLFANNEVLSVTNVLPEEEDDIDILT